MKKLSLAILATLSIAVVTVWAADFWAKKKYPEWTQKEVQKMLNDSPWARPVEIRLEGVGGRSGGGGGRRRGGGGGMPSAASGGGMSGGEDFGGGGPSRSGGLEPDAVPTTIIHLRWHSALPIKQAVARERFADEVASSPEAARMLERQEAQYVLGVTELPASAVRGNPDLKSKAALKLKGKPPIQAAEVKVDRGQGRVNLYYFFPKGQDNSPVIALEDGDVELVLRVGSLDIKRRFRLKDMVFEGKLEI